LTGDHFFDGFKHNYCVILERIVGVSYAMHRDMELLIAMGIISITWLLKRQHREKLEAMECHKVDLQIAIEENSPEHKNYIEELERKWGL
jgi:hypothetical protein